MGCMNARYTACKTSIAVLLTYLPITLLFAVTLFAFPGCAGFEGLIQEPEARIASVDFIRIDFESVSLVVNVEIDNPNPLGLSLSAYDYGLEAWDSTVIEGRRDDSVTLKAGGVSRLPIPVILDFTDLLSVGGSVLSADSVPLGIRLGLEVDIPYMAAVRLDLSGSVELPIPRPPLVIPRSIRVDHVGFGGAEITLLSDIENPNAFPLEIRSLEGRLSVAGSSWGEVSMKEAVRLTSESRSSIAIAIGVDFGEVGRSAWTLLTGAGRADVKLDGAMDVDVDLPGFDGSGIPWDADAKVSILR